MAHIEVKMDKANTAVYPDILFSEGFGPCVGVAVINGNRGFLLHSANPYVPDGSKDKMSEVDSFLKDLDKYLPCRAERKKLKPLLFGAVIEKLFDDPKADAPVHEGILQSRQNIREILRTAGFETFREHWAKPNEMHSAYLYLDKKIAVLHIEKRGISGSKQEIPFQFNG
jgi:hypothetical protein